MAAGRLRHRVEIGRYVEGRNEWGDPLPPTWQTVATVWAAVEALTGRLFFEARQTAEQSDHKVTIRWRRGIEPGMIARHDGREFVIQAVLDREGTRRWLQLICREVKPA
ncbi:MAG TPA: phage head closure protein [Phycisphaerae bacterium]|nr:phage head closure protein [Phycisphaerae bacterium]